MILNKKEEDKMEDETESHVVSHTVSEEETFVVSQNYAAADYAEVFLIHARRELETIGEESATIDWYCRVIEEFHSIGHSGGSLFATIPVLVRLLKMENLSPITNNPDEWYDHSELSGYPMWQNNRNSEAFSNDGGTTYYLISEGGNDKNREPLHTSLQYPTQLKND